MMNERAKFTPRYEDEAAEVGLGVSIRRTLVLVVHPQSHSVHWFLGSDTFFTVHATWGRECPELRDSTESRLADCRDSRTLGRKQVVCGRCRAVVVMISIGTEGSGFWWPLILVVLRFRNKR